MPTLNPNNYAYLWSPTRQILDKNGKPLVGGYVMLNQHGTTGIEALSYSDWNGTLNARRILLDGLGRASAIVENDKLYDMYVYNKFNVLEYSALGVNCTGEGGGDSPMRFTSNDGSITIYRSGNNVDFSVNKDPSTYGSATGDSIDSGGALVFDNASGDITIISSNKLSLNSGKMYHVTVQAEISIPTAKDSYYDCTMRDSENVEHKFSIDGSRATQIVDLSWDLVATHDYFRMYFSLPSGVNVSDVVLYIHSVNSISIGGGSSFTQVYTDNTLTGNGTEENPLGVAESITEAIADKLSSVSVDGTTITGDGTPSNPLVAAAQPQEQADWAQTNTQAVDYIKNKPQNLVQDASYVHTDNNFTDADKSKLDGIESGAEANVQADWNQTNSSADDYIKNKPTIPAAQVQSNWTQSDSEAVDYIKNKPNLATVATSGSYNDLTDKPSIPSIPVQDVEVNGTSVVNAQGVAEVTVPTKTSDLNNDSGFITASQVPAQEQADWNQSNSSAVDYIKNKPQNLVQDASYVHTDNNFTNSDKNKLDGIAAGAEVNVQADWSQSDSAADDYIKNKPQNLVQDASYVHTDNNFTTTLKDKLDGIEAGAEVNVQSDWNQSDNTADDYIKNKPQNLVQDASYVHTDNNFTTTLKDKLDGIAAGAEVNVQSDWNQTDNTADDYIKNKPQNLVQDASYVHTDNNFTTTLKDKLDGIAAGAEVNVQADWNQSDSNADDYIKNKPTINNVPVVTSSDDGKILKASYSGGVGSYSWETESGGTVTDVLVDGSSVVNAQGQAIIAMPTDLVPTVTSSDDGKILTATYSGGQASYAWTAPQTFSQQQSNWTQSDSSAVDYIKNKPSLIPLIAGSNITITESGGALTISASGGNNAVTDVKVDGSSVVNAQGVAVITTPTNLVPAVTSVDDGKLLKASYNNNTGMYSWETVTIPAAQVNSDWNAASGVAQILNKPTLATVATSGSYNDLTDKPTIPTIPVVDVEVNGSSVVSAQGVAEITVPAAQVNSDWSSSSGVSQILNKPDLSVYALSANLATVATSGSYNDLSNKPTIPAAQVNSDWNSSSGVSQILNKPSIPVIGTVTL